jgi:predicted negative regulator of RcsB-dependent stress response
VPQNAILAESTRAESAYFAAYHCAQEAYRAAEFSKAAAEFRQCLEHWPEDKLAALYLDRCAYFLDHPPTAEWSGIHIASHK